MGCRHDLPAPVLYGGQIHPYSPLRTGVTKAAARPNGPPLVRRAAPLTPDRVRGPNAPNEKQIRNTVKADGLTWAWDNILGGDEQSSRNGWFQADEFIDVAISLRTLDMALKGVARNPTFWKLAILSSHSALQGACVCILTGTDGTGALAEKSEKALMNKLYGETQNGRNFDDDTIAWPEEFIASLPELVKRLPNKLGASMCERSAESYPLSLEGDLRRLHDFRKKLTHFPPTSWSLEIAGLPRILLCAVDLTEGITKSDGYRRFNRFQDMDLQPGISSIRACLVAMRSA